MVLFSRFAGSATRSFRNRLADHCGCDKSALQKAITNSYPGKNIVGVVFNATYATTPPGHPSTVYLEPDNTSPGHVWQIGGTNNHVLCLTLICQHHIKGGPISHQNNPGASESPIPNLPWPGDDQDEN